MQGRVKVGLAALGLALLGATLVIGGHGSGKSRVVASRPQTVQGPGVWALTVVAADGQPITGWRTVDAGLTGSNPPRWVVGEAGAGQVKVEVSQPVSPVWRTLVEVIGRERGAQAVRWQLHGERYQPAVRPRITTTVVARLSQDLAHVLPPGGQAVVVGADGSVLAAVGNPRGQGVAWQPFPAGTALMPPLMAMALGQPGLWPNNLPLGGWRAIGDLATRWGGQAIWDALQRLGVGREVLAGAPVAPPPLPAPSPALLSRPGLIWVTGLELARAYLPFIDNGAAPPLHVIAGEGGQAAPVGDGKNFQSVAALLPKLTTPSVAFRVWRWQAASPGGANVAVLFSDHPAVVAVFAGNHLPLDQLGQRLGAWASRVTPSKSSPGR